MKMSSLPIRLGLLALLVFAAMAPRDASAACSSPAGNAGDVFYSSTSSIMVYCNGTSWISMGTSSTTSFGTLTTGNFCTATSGTSIACNTASINLATMVSGGLGIANGGTNATSQATNGINYYNGTSITSNANFVFNGTQIGIGTPTPVAAMTVYGTSAFMLGTDYTTTGSQSDVAINTASTIRYNGAATATFYGIVAGVNGQIIYLHNASSYTLTLSNQSGSEATAANKIITGTNADLAMAANSSIILQYDTSAGRWRVIGGSGGGGGTPGGANTQVQYNNSSAFGGNNNFSFNSTNAELTVGTGAATPAASTGTVATFAVNVIPQSTIVAPVASSGVVAVNTAATGQMAYYSGGSAISGTPNLYVSGSNIGLGTSTPTNILSLAGSGAQTIWMERNPTANTAGNNLTIQASGATTGATNKNGGNLILSGGISTGTGSSSIQFQTYNTGATGTSDDTASTVMTVTGGNVNVNGTMAATTFSGSGASLTGIGTASLTGITGTANSTTYLRGDGTWGTPSGGGSGTNTTPNTFTFTTNTGVALNSLSSSNVVTISGLGVVPVVASVSGSGSPQISVAGGAWTTSTTLMNGQTIQARMTSSTSATTTLTATITVGSGSATFSTTTVAVTPGSQTYSTPGTYSFTIPAYNNLTVTVRGGGGGGQGGSISNSCGYSTCSYGGGAGGTGGASTFSTLSGNGGGGTGTAGTGSGGTTNTTGGGAAGGSGGGAGCVPWGYGSLCGSGGANGGAGGLASKVFTTSAFTGGSTVTVVVGGGGAGGGGGCTSRGYSSYCSGNGSNGSNGNVVLSWN